MMFKTARIMNLFLLLVLFILGVLSFFEYVTFDDWKPLYKFIGGLKSAGFDRGFFGVLGMILVGLNLFIFFAWVKKRQQKQSFCFEKRDGKIKINYSAICELIDYTMSQNEQIVSTRTVVEKSFHGLIVHVYLKVYPLENQVAFLERMQRTIRGRINDVFSIKDIASIEIQIKNLDLA